MEMRKTAIVLAHAFVGWALCGATMGIGLATMSVDGALLVHAIGAPVFFSAVSLFYFRRFNFTTPFATAWIFVGFVIVVDFFLVALLINKSLEMFASVLGTWITFVLIFVATFVTGMLVSREVSRGSVNRNPALTKKLVSLK